MTLDRKLKATLKLDQITNDGMQPAVPLVMMWAMARALFRRGIIDEALLTSELDLLQSVPSIADDIRLAAEQAKLLFDTELLMGLFPDGA
ncbi:MAG TPA: hypothetical protein VIH42_14550 [Thermoguttaceae bacterium]